MTARTPLLAVFAIVLLGVGWSWWHRDGTLALNPAVTADTMAATICVSGYTKTVRPPSSVMRQIKLGLLRRQGDDVVLGHWVLDHRIPLAIGGAPRDLRNLHLQSIVDGHRKDRIERKLQCLVCTGQVALADAQRAIWRDWRAAYAKWAGLKCHRHRVARARP